MKPGIGPDAFHRDERARFTNNAPLIRRPGAWPFSPSWCMMWHAPKGPVGVIRVTVRPVTGRIRVAVGAGMLFLAVGASACSANPPSSGRSLPISVVSDSKGVHPTKCTLNAAGTQATATGRFSPSASLPVVGGQQVGALQLQLFVVSSKSLRVGPSLFRNPEVGEAVAGVSVGQTTWHLVTPIERGLGSDRLVAR